MDNLYIAATQSSPEVDFRFTENSLLLKGESYPENAAAFYSKVIASLSQYLDKNEHPDGIEFNVNLVYFNSSSTKILFTIFGALNDKAATGTKVTTNWYRDADDDTMFEFGQDLKEDFSYLDFRDHAINCQ